MLITCNPVGINNNKYHKLNTCTCTCTLYMYTLHLLNSDWAFVSKMPRDFSKSSNQLFFVNSPELVASFPNLTKLMKFLLILPIGTASVESSFSAMNRILNSERNRLTPQHLSNLMLISRARMHKT